MIQSIVDALGSRGLHLLKTRAPGGTPAGQVIRDLLLHSKEPLAKRTELLLFLADRAEHVEKVIKPALESGQIVLCDRYNDSTLAYQGGARGFEMENLEMLVDFAAGGLQPNLTLYLDLDPAVGLQRCKQTSESADQIESEEIAFHQKIRKTFHQIASKHPTRIQILDASQSKESVFEQALRLIDVHCFAANA